MFDKKRSLLNVVTSIVFKLILFICGLVIRRALIQHLGNNVNGLNSLYASIIGVLSVVELGIGSAITFCMYKPIVDGDKKKVAALYQLFQKAYISIGFIVMAAGVVILPFLPMLAKDYTAIDINIYSTFGLVLVSVVISYLFGSKISLINAYKDNYITTVISSCGALLQYILQYIVLTITGSFEWYLVCQVLGAVVQWIMTELVVRKRRRDILVIEKQTIDFDTKSQVLKNIKALFMHKVGEVLVNSADGMIISAFIGVGVLGLYSNYTLIITSMMAVIVLFFSPLTSIIGHLFVKDIEQAKRYFNFFYNFNYALGVLFFLGYYAVVDNMVALLFGEGLELAKPVSFVITVNYFIQFMRRSTLLFRDASGTFYNDRWKPFLEGLLNVVLSISFVYLFTHWLGEDVAIVGVIVATIITNLAICHIVEPYVLYRYGFNTSVKSQLLKNYTCIAIFVLALFALDACMVSSESNWVEIFANGGISTAFSIVIIVITEFVDRDFKDHLANIKLFNRK